MSPLEQPNAAHVHWRSLGELLDSPRYRQFLEAEFPSPADPSGMTRRRWLQLMGASLALAGAGGCRWEKAEIRPLVHRPEGRVPGEPEYYATAMDSHGSAVGLLVTARDGRPIKIEGNPAHPMSLGAADAFSQAAVLQLYDPDRSQSVRQPSRQDNPRLDWDQFAAFAQQHFKAHKDSKGAGLGVLAEASSSPTLAALRSRWLEAFPASQWFEYEPLSADHAREGARMAFGKPYRCHLHLDRAEVIACLDADLFSGHPAAMRYARQFAQGREPTGGKMSRLYAMESRFSITGAAADHRLPLRSGQIAVCVTSLEAELQRLLGGGANGSPAAAAGPFIAALAKDLMAHRGRSIVAVGSGQPPQVHAAAHRINHLLGNVGHAVSYTQEPDPNRPPHMAALAELVAQIHAGQGSVETLIVLGGNPVYNAPADLNFADAYAKVPTRLHLGLYYDETSRLSSWHLPQAHFLESWGDGRAYDGTYSVVQPLISPLYGGKSASELLAVMLGEDPGDGYALVRRTFQELFGQTDVEQPWQAALQVGLVENSEWETLTPPLQARPREPAETASQPSEDTSLEIAFCASGSVHDGRWANSSWLQETPDPLTKLTWDNAALISPVTAQELGIETDTLVKLTYGGRSLQVPAYILPGQAPGSICLALGYGRTAAGQVGGDAAAGVAAVGVNAYLLQQSSAPCFDTGLEVQSTGKAYLLASTEDHRAIDTVGLQERAARLGQLVREATLEEYRQRPDFAQHAVHHPPLESLWKEWSYAGHRWGMSIDLAKCIGCNACLVACQAENNIPVVGKDLVLKGREMHWLRVDRYFQGDPENPRVTQQAVACHHCENAPCEQVCPVAATVHSREGLNDMVYNRCVGTRYCANNCPYKVRRFNYFYYHKDLHEPENEVRKMVFNPEVTIRTRGVMEKCTYCVQRIQAVKIDAKNAGRPIQDGEIRTACQQACPTQAIEFGDLSDANSRVAQAAAEDRAYAMLAELNIKPRTNYLAKIRNPNPELEPADHEHDRPRG